MSTLLIEGGKRLSGTVEVEGNKNAALPLLAACLLTTDECVLHNVPRIGDVEVMARLLLDLGAEVEGIGGTTLRIRCPIGHQGRAGPVARRPAPRFGAAARAAAREAGRRAACAARRRLSGAADDRDPSRCAHGDGRARPRRSRSSARGGGRSQADIHLSLRSVGHRHRDRAARRCGRAGRFRNPSCRVRAARRRAVRVPLQTRRSRQRHRLHHATGRRGRPSARGRAPALGRLHRGRQLGGGGGDHRRRHRHTRRQGRRHGSRRGRPEAALRRVRDGGRPVSRQPLEAEGRRPHHDRAVAGLPERSDQPRDGAGDAGRGPHPGARLAVRTAPVRPRADERR